MKVFASDWMNWIAICIKQNIKSQFGLKIHQTLEIWKNAPFFGKIFNFWVNTCHVVIVISEIGSIIVYSISIFLLVFGIKVIFWRN
jgi:hypothetical protein